MALLSFVPAVGCMATSPLSSVYTRSGMTDAMWAADPAWIGTTCCLAFCYIVFAGFVIYYSKRESMPLDIKFVTVFFGILSLGMAVIIKDTYGCLPDPNLFVQSVMSDAFVIVATVIPQRYYFRSPIAPSYLNEQTF